MTFGAVVDDGWGIWYGIENNCLRFVVTGGPTAPFSATLLAEAIVGALRDMYALMKQKQSRL